MKRKLQYVRGSYRTILPKEIAQDLKIRPTDRLNWSIKTIDGKKCMVVEVVE